MSATIHTEPPSVPLLKSSEEQVAKMRRRLEEVFINLSLVHDVITLCVELGNGSARDFTDEMANVLRRCAADRLRNQMNVITKIVERLDGTTAFSFDEQPASGRTSS